MNIRKLLPASMLCLGLVCLGGSARGPALAQKKDEPEKKTAHPEPGREQTWPADWKFSGAGQCVLCHTTGPIKPRTDEFVLCTEYATWRTQDRHSLAYLVLKGKRAQHMGELLEIADVSQEAACLSCHSVNVPEARRAFGFAQKDGVSCDGCHGPSEKWLQKHTDPAWRLAPPEEKWATYGMRDLRDPTARTELCMSCHVGDASQGRVVTHVMYAAGHPPLPNFEVATFSRRLPQHWRDKRDVPFFTQPPQKIGATPVTKELLERLYQVEASGFQQEELALASSLAGLRCSLRLVADRSDLAKALDPAAQVRVWPELTVSQWKDKVPLPQLWPQLAMGQANCAACHHELRRPTWRVFDGVPGRVQTASWPWVLARHGFGLTGQDARAELDKHLEAVRGACNIVQFGDPSKLSAAARQSADWLGEPLSALNLRSATLPQGPLLSQLLAGLPEDRLLDYDSARQVASAIIAIYREWNPAGQNAERIEKILASLEREFDLGPPIGRKKRLQVIKEMLDKGLLPTADDLDAFMYISEHGLALKGLPAANTDKKREALRRAVDQALGAVQRGGEGLPELVLGKEGAAFFEKIDEIGDEALKTALEKSANYQPAAFRSSLKELKQLLDGK